MEEYYRKTPIQERIENMITNGLGYEPEPIEPLNLSPADSQAQLDHYFAMKKIRFTPDGASLVTKTHAEDLFKKLLRIPVLNVKRVYVDEHHQYPILVHDQIEGESETRVINLIQDRFRKRTPAEDDFLRRGIQEYLRRTPSASGNYKK
jgi:hypothetical protein